VPTLLGCFASADDRPTAEASAIIRSTFSNFVSNSTNPFCFYGPTDFKTTGSETVKVTVGTMTTRPIIDGCIAQK
jgi:hypothetical protein